MGLGLAATAVTCLVCTAHGKGDASISCASPLSFPCPISEKGGEGGDELVLSNDICTECRDISFWTMPGSRRRLVLYEGEDLFIQATNTFGYGVTNDDSKRQNEVKVGQEKNGHGTLSAMKRESLTVNFEQKLMGGGKSVSPHNSASLEEDNADYHLAFDVDNSIKGRRERGAFHALKSNVKRVGIKAITSVLALAVFLRHGTVAPNLVVAAPQGDVSTSSPTADDELLKSTSASRFSVSTKDGGSIRTQCGGLGNVQTSMRKKSNCRSNDDRRQHIALLVEQGEEMAVESWTQRSANVLGAMGGGLLREGEKTATDFVKFLTGSKRDVLLLTLSSALVQPFSKHVSISPILGFLAAGTLLGPSGLGLISDVHTVDVLGELGIMFFLFEMGLELSINRLMQLKKDVFLLGASQFFLTAFGISLVARMAGFSTPAQVVIGGGLALSSSAFVLQLLKDKDATGTNYGRSSLGVLLFQDLAVVPLLVVIPLLRGGVGTNLPLALFAAAAKTVLVVTFILTAGKKFLDRLYYLVARGNNEEAFLAMVLLTVLGMAFLTEGLGLNGTLGAFLAGVALSETKYRYQVEADASRPRGLLLGLFFMTVGFEIDLFMIAKNLPLMCSLLVGLLTLKTAVTTLLCLSMGLSPAYAQQTGVLLSQGGEFAFVAFGMADRMGILPTQLTKALLSTVALSMATTPYLNEISTWVTKSIQEKLDWDHWRGNDKSVEELKKTKDFILVVGYGRVGKLICELLDSQLEQYVVFESNPDKAKAAGSKGLPVFYGDVTRSDILRKFNAQHARLIISTISDPRTAMRAAIKIHQEFPSVNFFARARDAATQAKLQNDCNCTAMVPILPENSMLITLPFGEAVLRYLGYPEKEAFLICEQVRRKAMASEKERRPELGITNQQLDTPPFANVTEEANMVLDALDGEFIPISNVTTSSSDVVHGEQAVGAMTSPPSFPPEPPLNGLD